MITVQLNEANFEYDIHSLVKAFYPEHDVLVKMQDREEFPESIFHMLVDYDHEKQQVSFTIEKDGTVEVSESVGVDFADRSLTKNQLKQQLYDMLSRYTGKVLPWGTLTGIRPTKIPLQMMEQGVPEDEIRQHMKETYFCSDEKIDLSMQVAGTEKELLSRIDYENGYSLYVGIPFCPSTCLYCSFTSYPLSSWDRRMDEYLDALEKEIDFTADIMKGKVLNSIYIGGGTPTSLNPQRLERLISKIGHTFHLFDENEQIVYDDKLLEFTVEAGRPDSITREKLEVLKRHNISRISINPQTMKDETLKLIGRHHTVQQTIDSFLLAREMGFDNINMDLILGLPEETMDDVRHTMEALEELKPDNITIHSLAIKRAARLRIQKEDYEGMRMENTSDMIDMTAEYCKGMGLEPYYLYRQKNMAGNFENVGYAAPGKAGVYNILIMEEKQTIMALGAGATTKVVFEHGTRMERAGNVKDIENYLSRIDEMIERKRKLLYDYYL